MPLLFSLPADTFSDTTIFIGQDIDSNFYSASRRRLEWSFLF